MRRVSLILGSRTTTATADRMPPVVRSLTLSPASKGQKRSPIRTFPLCATLVFRPGLRWLTPLLAVLLLFAARPAAADFVNTELATTAQSGVSTSLQVENGTGDGSYAPGTLVTVTADPAPEGQPFVGWTGDIAILSNPMIASTTAIIPSMDVGIVPQYGQMSQIPFPMEGAQEDLNAGNSAPGSASPGASDSTEMKESSQITNLKPGDKTAVGQKVSGVWTGFIPNNGYTVRVIFTEDGPKVPNSTDIPATTDTMKGTFEAVIPADLPPGKYKISTYILNGKNVVGVINEGVAGVIIAQALVLS
jgi:Divergent InlB B-repeat domain